MDMRLSRCIPLRTIARPHLQRTSALGKASSCRPHWQVNVTSAGPSILSAIITTSGNEKAPPVRKALKRVFTRVYMLVAETF